MFPHEPVTLRTTSSWVKRAGGSSHEAAYFAARHAANEESMEYFAIGVCVIVAVVTSLYWFRRLYVLATRTAVAKEKKTPGWALPIVVLSRYVNIQRATL